MPSRIPLKKKMRRLLLALPLLLTLCGNPAFTQTTNCGDRDQIVETLSRKYDEQQVFLGVTTGTSLVEVFASESGTWTALVSHPNGISCMVSSGTEYFLLEKIKGDKM